MNKTTLILIILGFSLNGFSQNVAFFNADGFFSIGTQSNQTASITLTDMDQDGYMDIVEGNSEERNYVHLGQKNREFMEIGLREDLKDDTYNIEIGDLDNDGLPDIVESNSGTWNLYYKTRKK